MPKIIVSFGIIIFFFTICFAQKSANPIVKKKSSRVIEISNMLGYAGGMKCLKENKPIIGTIVKRWFEDDEVTLAGIIVRNAKDKRKSVNIDSDHMFLLGRTTPEILSDFLEKDKKVQIWYFDCSGGGSGVFSYANKIKVI